MRLTFLLFTIFLLCQCGSPQPPDCRFLPHNSRTPSATALASAKANWIILADPRRKADWPIAEKAYNDSIRILFDQLRCGPGIWSERASKIGTSISKPTRDNENPEDFDALFPASKVKLRMRNRHKATPGLGIEAIGWKTTTPVGIPRPQFYPPNGQPRSVTVLLDFSSPTPQWYFHKRWIKENHQVGANQHFLSADWTAPIDFFWHMCELDNLRIQNVLIPERYTKETGLYFLQPYDPNKIPVVMVHGLLSSPDAYRYIINDLSPEPWFRENYQVWLYNYPTGTPWLYNAMRFRQNMEQAVTYARSKGTDKNLNEMVILTHSMGGLLTRTAITDPKTKLYDAHFKRPIDKLPVKPETRELIREGLLYKPFKTPSRVIFMAVPHQGSPMSNFRGTSLISNLIKLPKSLTVGLLDATFQNVQESFDGQTPISQVRPPTALSSLSPNSLGFSALKNMPLPSDIKFHSILGDKGHGDTPHSSDGVVPYWSSHVSPVASELIVPSNHSVPDHPATADEIKRILFLHLKENNILRPTKTNPQRIALPMR